MLPPGALGREDQEEIQGSSPGVPPEAAGAWPLPSPAPLGCLRKMGIGEAFRAEEEKRAHEGPGETLTSRGALPM